MGKRGRYYALRSFVLVLRHVCKVPYDTIPSLNFTQLKPHQPTHLKSGYFLTLIHPSNCNALTPNQPINRFSPFRVVSFLFVVVVVACMMDR